MRILVGTLAIILCACSSKSVDSSDPNATPPPGFVEAVKQFFEIGSTSATIAPIHRVTGAAATNLTLRESLTQITEDIRRVYGDANSYLEGFPAAEETYRTVPGRYKASAALIIANKSNADPATVQRRLRDLGIQADEVIKRQHTRFNLLLTAFNQRIGDIEKKAPTLEQSCAKIQATPSAQPEDLQACTGFQDASTMLKTKSDLVISGFGRLEDVYKETLETEKQTAAAVAAGKKPNP